MFTLIGLFIYWSVCSFFKVCGWVRNLVADLKHIPSLTVYCMAQRQVHSVEETVVLDCLNVEQVNRHFKTCTVILAMVRAKQSCLDRGLCSSPTAL